VKKILTREHLEGNSEESILWKVQEALVLSIHFSLPMQAELAIAHAELTRIHTPTVPALQEEQEHHPAVSRMPPF
jgi:hypothetical protein